MTDLHDGVYKYTTFRLEDLVPPKAEGDLIAVKFDGDTRATTHVARHQSGQLVWLKIQELTLPSSQEESPAGHVTKSAEKGESAESPVVPIPMILTCPLCNGRHIDVGEFATKVHHTHACQHCGIPWRPAIVPTVGVQFLPGFKNE